MAIMIRPVFEARKSAVYTGTNSADFNAAIADFTITSETPLGLTFTSDGNTFTVAPGGYIVWYQGVVTEVFQNQMDFEEVYADVLEAGGDHFHEVVLTSGGAKPLEETP